MLERGPGSFGSATAFNRSLYRDFWENCPDFARYNPGARHRRRYIARTLGRLHFDTLLDVGCGDGELLTLLRSQFPAGVSFYGVDLSQATIERNRTRYPFATFDVLDVQRESLDRTFGAILCTEVIEHLDDPGRAIANLARMLSAGGQLIVTCPTGKVHATERHFGHVAHPTARALRTMLTDANLDVLRCESWGFPTYTALKYATNLRAEWAMKNFGTTTYSSGAKLLCHALYAANFLNAKSSPFGSQLFAIASRPR
jgi:2-polyprenyl-3-methyl-5-hydroxy-6-metoxy-1,4-benzoquinol methylase